MDSNNKYKKSIFPDPMTADEDGLLCIGGHLTVRTLLDAYYHGIFPWPQEAFPILWFCPITRGILEFKKIHISKKLRQFRNNWKGEFRIDTSFKEVISSCKSQKRPGQSGTWIIPQMIHSYTDLHKAGYAHSVEAWENDELVGGIYGVFIGNVFSGESMFYKRSNCSKLCLWYLSEHLQSIGLEWMDLQMLTPITKTFGGEYISREEFLNRLHNDHRKPEMSF